MIEIRRKMQVERTSECVEILLLVIQIVSSGRVIAESCPKICSETWCLFLILQGFLENEVTTK